MAEFAEILNIISHSMEYTDNQFLNAYKKYRNADRRGFRSKYGSCDYNPMNI
jgi:hypothetical protein